MTTITKVDQEESKLPKMNDFTIMSPLKSNVGAIKSSKGEHDNTDR